MRIFDHLHAVSHAKQCCNPTGSCLVLHFQGWWCRWEEMVFAIVGQNFKIYLEAAILGMIMLVSLSLRRRFMPRSATSKGRVRHEVLQAG